MSDWHGIMVAADCSHHLRGGKPLYPQRYEEVLKFHEPGLAAVLAADGAYHIDIHGNPAYSRRFFRAFGYYEARAAVSGADGWHHITADGVDLYPARFAWCGNYQGGRATVRTGDGMYLHLRPDGREAYQARHLYAGDFRDGIGCVRRQSDGRCIHIDPDGQPVHAQSYLDLDVFHKGMARARDETGWCHVRRDGTPAYKARFAAVEPFYNGQAFCETHDGRRVIVDESGEVEHEVWDPAADRAGRHGEAIVVAGNIGAGKSSVASALSRALGWPHIQIDGFRQQFGDGTAAGEISAWAALIREMQLRSAVILEFTGSGPFAPLVRQMLDAEHRRYLVLWIRTDVATCQSRIADRTWPAPYPDFGVPIAQVVDELGCRLEREMKGGTHWRVDQIKQLNGDVALAQLTGAAVTTVQGWLVAAGGGKP